MKTKIFAVLTTGLAVLFMGAVPNSNTNKQSQNAQRNSGVYVCGYYGRGRMMYGANDSSFVCPYANYNARPQEQKGGK